VFQFQESCGKGGGGGGGDDGGDNDDDKEGGVSGQCLTYKNRNRSKAAKVN